MHTNNKAQVSVEYLVMYGWAFIIILGSIAALFSFGIFDFTPYVQTRCDFYTGVYCTEFVTNQSGVTLRIQNGLPINMDEITVEVENCAIASGPTAIAPGDIETYFASCTVNADKIFDTKLFFNYTNPDSGVSHIKLGRLVDRVS